MRVLDLFSGTGSATEAFRRLGHEVISSDLTEPATVNGDILEPLVQKTILELGPYDFVWASPPCNAFSVASIGRHWNPDGSPKSELAVKGEAMVRAALDVIARSGAPFWAMENPRGMLRTRKIVAHLERRTVTYCRLGSRNMKPTDIWGAFPPRLVLPPPCRRHATCHVAAPRGALTGLQGVNGARDRGRIPYALSLLFALALSATQEPLFEEELASLRAVKKPLTELM